VWWLRSKNQNLEINVTPLYDWLRGFYGDSGVKEYSGNNEAKGGLSTETTKYIYTVSLSHSHLTLPVTGRKVWTKEDVMTPASLSLKRD
jgi:hypothetical protein